MQTKLLKIFLALMIAICGVAISNVASARCVWVKGYWANGYYHHGHKVCGAPGYRTGYGCRWVGGYRGPNGYWHPRQRVCR